MKKIHQYAIMCSPTTAQFAAIGESIEDMNFNLERAAMEIDDIDLVRAVYGSMPSVTEEDVKQEYMEATDSTILTNEIVEEKEQPVSTDSTVNNVETNYDVIEKDNRRTLRQKATTYSCGETQEVFYDLLQSG